MPGCSHRMRSLVSREYTRNWRFQVKEVGWWRPKKIAIIQLEVRSTYRHMINKTPLEDIITWHDATEDDLQALGFITLKIPEKPGARRPLDAQVEKAIAEH